MATTSSDGLALAGIGLAALLVILLGNKSQQPAGLTAHGYTMANGSESTGCLPCAAKARTGGY